MPVDCGATELTDLQISHLVSSGRVSDHESARLRDTTDDLARRARSVTAAS